MRENATTFRTPFTNGLRPHGTSDRRKEYFVEMHHGRLVDGTFRAVQRPLPIVWPVEYPLPTYPFPQLLRLRHYLLLCSATLVFMSPTYQPPHTWQLVYATNTPGNTWTCADFGEYFVLCNSLVALEWDITNRILAENANFPLQPQCVTNYNNQLVFGGVNV